MTVRYWRRGPCGEAADGLCQWVSGWSRVLWPGSVQVPTPL